MYRCSSKLVFTCLVGLLCVPGLALGADESAPRRPNVLFVSIDDLKPLLGCYGASFIKSPAIDGLAKRGTLFRSAYCQVPLCAPTRASILTGLRPDSTRIYFNPFKVKDIVRSRVPDVVTLPQHFRNQGYVTCAMGKVFDGRTVDGGHDALSWSEGHVRRFDVAPGGIGFRGYQNPRTQEHLKSAMKASPGKHVPGPAFEGWEGPDNIYYDGAMARTAVSKINEFSKREQPFFLAVGFVKPHLPFIAPKKYWDLYDRSSFKLASFQMFPEGVTPQGRVFPNSGELRGYAGVPRTGPIPEDMQRELLHAYAACVSYIDAQVGLMLQALKNNGIDDNTIVCVWGDHGWHLGEHGHWGKSTTYEDATRSPLVIYDPRIKKGAPTDSLVELLDIYPTLCELAGLPRPEHLQGKSLVPVMRDPTIRLHDAVITQSSTVDSQMSPKLVGGQLDEFAKIESHMGLAVRTGRYRYVEWRRAVLEADKTTYGSKPVGVEFYDYEKDPLERKNLATDPAYKHVIRKHQELLDRRLPHLPSRNAETSSAIPREFFEVEKTTQIVEAFEPVADFDRHDPSNVIRCDGRYWLFYTRNIGDHREVSIHHAVSDDGRVWRDLSFAFGGGSPGSWDESGTIAPYVVPFEGKYHLFYTGFRDGDLDTRELGCAIANSPEGPWGRWAKNPILRRGDSGAWDSGMLGDSNVIFRDGRWWLYFKSRRCDEGPRQTRVGVAFASNVTGPYRKYEENPIFPGHAFSAWVHRDGVAAVCGVVSPKIRWSTDGIHFVDAGEMANASTGFYCPENFGNGFNPNGVRWGIERYHRGARRGLRRFDCSLTVR